MNRAPALNKGKKSIKLLGQYGTVSLLAIGAVTCHAGSGPLGESGFFSAGQFKVQSESYSAIELTYIAEYTDVFALKYGVAFYDGVPVKYGSDDFVGLTAAGYYHFNHDIINPYIGLGAFGGKTFNCSDSQEQFEECEEEGMLSLYPELGLAIKLDQFFIYPYVRRSFSTNNGGEAANVMGVAVGFGF